MEGVTVMSEAPITRRDDVVEILHGESVADPYRWLEDTESAETAAWVSAQNAFTSRYLGSLPAREAIRERLSALWDGTRWGIPYEHGGKWFFTRHDGGVNQPVLRVAEAPDVDGRVLLDPNPLSADGTMALGSWSVSPDGRLLAYALSSAGSDWWTWRVRDVETGVDRDDLVEWSKWSNAAWLPDGSGFFYGALDPPTAGKEFTEREGGQWLALHLIGTAQESDQVVYADADPQRTAYVETTGDGRWLVIRLTRGTDPESALLVLDLTDREAGLRPLVPEPVDLVDVAGSSGTTFFVRTDRDASRRRVVAIELDRPEPEHWREVVPESADAIEHAAYVGGRLLVHVLHDASSQLQIWSTDGERLGDVDLPEHVTVMDMAGGADRPTAYLGVTSFTDPASVWATDLSSGASREVHGSALPIDAASIVVTRASAPSTDGTEVPMFLVHRRDVIPTGDVPVLLYGYGGYGISITPTFNAGRLVWVERGGLLAIANLRGGGEYGKEWYDAGRLANKQNVFDDFAGCARWLASSGWSRADRIAVNGGSNGGLLVGATLTQHPELIGAAVAEVGVLDMLRYHLFTIGWAWTSDYGNPEDPEQYQWVRAFSPLHNVAAGAAYPPTLIMTGDHDDRVVPAHSFKFAATLQAAQSGEAPVLIRIETSAGHGASTPVSKQIDGRADMLAFTAAALGVDS
jgi:prolyl oligopeptidase